MVALLDDKLKGSLCGFIGALLLKDYDVLVAFTEYNRNVIRLEPPLIATREHATPSSTRSTTCLSRGIIRIVKDFVGSQIG
jgi:acetylornithine/succinyldiaminopimelate/putrescine aminotransferase